MVVPLTQHPLSTVSVDTVGICEAASRLRATIEAVDRQLLSFVDEASLLSQADATEENRRLTRTMKTLTWVGVGVAAVGVLLAAVEIWLGITRK